MLISAKHLLRLGYVGGVLTRAYYGRDGRLGERLCVALQKLGPSFIKLGQSLSTRSDLLGDELAGDLAQLQDNLPPFSVKKVRKVIEAEFDTPLEELYSEFDKKPVAAASIAQVHFAKDMAGKEVAVKVLRPGIKKAFARDNAFFYWAIGVLEVAFPKLRKLEMKKVVEVFEQTVKTEIDLRLEAAAATELRENFAEDESLRVPEIDWQRTSERVMTSVWIKGMNIDEVSTIAAAGHDPKKIVEKAARVYFKQVFDHGYFHADMHPGNLFVADDGNLVVVDFGIMGRLDKQTQMYLAEMLIGFLTRDYRKVADVHFAAGYVPADQSREAFALACRSIGEPIFGLPQHEISIARLLGQLFKIAEDFHMQLQPQLLLLQKSMMLAEGVGRKLYPEANMWLMAEPLIKEWAVTHLGPQAKAKEMADNLKRVPVAVDNLLEAAEHLPQVITKDGIKLHPDTVEQLAQRNQTPWLKIMLVAGLIGLLIAWVV